MPERFGVLDGRRIVNKQPDSYFASPGPYSAWGALSWSQKCAGYWWELAAKKELDYTTAINMAIERFGLSHWRMSTYRDMANICEYQAYWRDLEQASEQLTVEAVA